MTSSTILSWEVDGVPLQTYAYNVTSIAAKFGSPKLRGSDRKYAFMHGSAHRPRKAESGSVLLGMWVIGQNDDGSVPADREVTFNRNLKDLIRLFSDVEGREFVLTKKWREESGIITAHGRGIVPDGIGVKAEGGPYRAKFTPEIHMADPFYYGDEVTVPVSLNTDVEIDNPGDAPSYEISLEFIGQLSNPRLTNTTPAPDVWVQVGSSIATGDGVDVSVRDATVIRQNDGANLIGALSHSGSRAWFGLSRGKNVIRLSSDLGAGSAVLKYQPVYY